MPRIKFDDRTIKAMSADDRSEFTDATLPGFGIRVTSQGKKTWFIFYRFSGRKRRFCLGTYPSVSLADARAAAKIKFGELAKGTDPADLRDSIKNEMTCKQLAENFFGLLDLEVASQRDAKRRIEDYLVEHLGNHRVSSITKNDIDDLVKQKVNQKLKVEPNRVLKDIRKMFNWARGRGVVKENPTDGVKMPKSEYKRDRVLRPEEVQKLWKAFDDEKNDLWAGSKKDKNKIIGILKLMLVLAQRGEIVKAMEWPELDFVNREWVVPKEKMKMQNPHSVYLPKTAIKILKELKLSCGLSKFVFPSPTDENSHIDCIQKAVERLRNRLGFDFTAHDLRRTAATNMSKTGAREEVISKVLGHFNKKTIKVYNHDDFFEERQEAHEAWDYALCAIISGDFEIRASARRYFLEISKLSS